MNQFDLINTISVPMDDGAEIAVFIYGPEGSAEAAKNTFGILDVPAPIVMLHGNGESHLNMMRLIEGAAPEHTVVAIDSRGHGESCRGKTAISYERMAKDVLAVLDYLGLDQVHLMGFSDGGIVAIKLGLTSSKRFLSMTIMGANLTPSGLRPDFLDHIAVDLRELEGFDVQDEDLSKYSQVELNSLMLNSPYINPARLKTITCPVAVMAGEHDLVLPEETCRLAEALPNSSLTFVDGASHDLPNDAPDAVLAEAAVAIEEGESTRI